MSFYSGPERRMHVRVQRWKWRALSVWVAVFSTAVVYGYYQTHTQVTQGTVAHKALCDFKLDLENRVESSKAFVKSHPNGVFGFSAAAIRMSLRNQEATVASLSLLHCKQQEGK